MPRSNTQSLAEVLAEMQARWNKDGKLDEVALHNWWDEMMGKVIANHTTALHVKKGKLIIHLDSSVLKEELSYSKSKIIELVNEKLGRDAVEEVIIR